MTFNKPIFNCILAQKRDDGTYVCRVKGGHCIDITYWDPLEPEKEHFQRFRIPIHL